MSDEKSIKKQHGSTIAQRWLYVTFFPTLVTVFVACFAMFYVTRQNYYSLAEQAIDFRIRSTVSLLPSSSLSRKDRYNGIVGLVEDFSEKDQFEFMILDSEGNILVTSSGFDIIDDSTVAEFEQANSSEEKSYTYISNDKNKEHVMAITKILSPDYGDAYAIRIVSSLEGVDKQVKNNTQLFFLVGGLMLLIVTLTGLLFVRSIVTPIKRLGIVAGRIAQGDFNTRIGEHYAGEIGDLVESIDNMAAALQQSNRLKNDFISSISHEIRTPLTAIKGWGETLNNVGNDPQLFNQGLDIIINETDRLSVMVEDLLDFSRLEGNNSLKYFFEDFDLTCELREAVITFQQRANNLGIKVIYNEYDKPLLVHGDKNRIKQVLVNVLDNALKYSFEKKPVEVRLQSEDDKALISISDQGPGIPEDEIEKVTEKFYRASNSVYGTGIGLSISKEIMEAHHGSMRISSKLGHGTTVYLSLPLLRSI